MLPFQRQSTALWLAVISRPMSVDLSQAELGLLVVAFIATIMHTRTVTSTNRARRRVTSMM